MDLEEDLKRSTGHCTCVPKVYLTWPWLHVHFEKSSRISGATDHPGIGEERVFGKVPAAWTKFLHTAEHW